MSGILILVLTFTALSGIWFLFECCAHIFKLLHSQPEPLEQPPLPAANQFRRSYTVRPREPQVVVTRVPPAALPDGHNPTESQTREGKEHDVVIDVYVEQIAEKEKNKCSICLSEFKDRERLGHLSECDHKFHVDCIRTWLMIKQTCPLCRINIGNVTRLLWSPYSTIYRSHPLQT